MGSDKWQEDNIFKGYELARQGLPLDGIAAGLGVITRTVDNWIAKYPAFANALRQGKAAALKQTQGGSFQEYVYDRLSENVRDLWDEIMAIDKAPNAGELLRTLMAGVGLRPRQNLFINALIYSRFNASQALRLVGLTYATLVAWTQDPEFMALMNEIQWHKKNFFEGALLDLVAAREPAAVLFVARTQLKDRGYGDKQSIEVSGSVQHSHDHTHAVVSLSDLKIPLEQRKRMLEEHRAKKAAATQNGIIEVKATKVK